MGGDREITVPGKVRSKSTKSTDQQIGDLRIHESKGKVHFHADKDDLKVAVPVNRWYTAWERLRTELGAWRFFDTKTSCALLVSTSKVDKGPGPGRINVALTIEKAEMSHEFESLDKFTND